MAGANRSDSDRTVNSHHTEPALQDPGRSRKVRGEGSETKDQRRRIKDRKTKNQRTDEKRINASRFEDYTQRNNEFKDHRGFGADFYQAIFDCVLYCVYHMRRVGCCGWIHRA